MRASVAKLLVLTAVCAACASPPVETPDESIETLDFAPDDVASWTLGNVFAPVTGLFLGGPGYWYTRRVVEIDTTPPGAVLDLFYVRRNFQKLYEQADAPVRIVLPPRIDATSRDSITVRALLDGHRQREVQLRVRGREESLMIDLDPLPNSLLAFTHTYFAGRGSLAFITKEALTFRLQKSEKGFSVVLTETANSPEASEMLEGVASSLVESARAQQLGEDLVVRIDLSERGRGEDIETRSRQGVDPIRGLHTFALDLVPADRGAAGIENARAALARIGPAAVTGCSLEFNRVMREQLDPESLARALSPDGSHTDKFMRAAMKRLGEVSPGGAIQMANGQQFRGAIPIELMAAATQAAEAIGYLALLRSFVAELEPEELRRVTLRGLLAPELSPSRFDAVVDAAESAENACSV